MDKLKMASSGKVASKYLPYLIHLSFLYLFFPYLVASASPSLKLKLEKPPLLIVKAKDFLQV